MSRESGGNGEGEDCMEGMAVALPAAVVVSECECANEGNVLWAMVISGKRWPFRFIVLP